MKGKKKCHGPYADGRQGFERKRAIWAFVSEHPGATKKEVADGVGLSKSGAGHHIDGLLATGVLVAGKKGTKGTLVAPVPLVVLKDGAK